VLLDHDVFRDVDFALWGKKYLLAGLLTLDEVKCFRYADNGPPASVARRTDAFLGEAVPGWAVLSPDDGSGIRGVRTADERQISDSAVVGNATQVAATDTQSDAYQDLDAAEASMQRHADVLAVMAAEAIGADIFISTRPYLQTMTWNVGDGVTVLGVDDALVALGMYLRAQSRYVTSRTPDGRGTHGMNRGLFFWVGAREVLPSAWRWFTGCVQHASGGGDDSLLYLGQSVLQRLQRALEVRDEVHIALNKPQNNDVADEALSSLDVVLLLLMGAVDATARVTHAVLALSGRANSAGWQRKDWVKKVTSAAPNLGAIFQPGTTESHVLTILTLLRNSIHGEALQPLGVGLGARRDRTLVGLPLTDEPELRSTFEDIGGLSLWGVEQLIPGRLHIDPGIVLEQLLPGVLAMLNRIMDETPVERLAHVSLQQSDSYPPTGPGAGSFIEQNRQSIRWQLGL
jgi:hypothetical protein